MSIKDLQTQIKEQKGNLRNTDVVIKDIKTQEQVKQLLQLLSNQGLQIKSLSIEIADEIADFFASELKNMQIYPDITSLSLRSIQLSHDGWEVFFDALKGFKTLEHLNLGLSNFDYSNDLRYLGGYLASNPQLISINICNKTCSSPEFNTGSQATELLGYLQNNTHLAKIDYGNDKFGVFGDPFSEEIQAKLGANELAQGISFAADEALIGLQDESFYQKYQAELELRLTAGVEDTLKNCTAGGTGIRKDKDGKPLSHKELYWKLCDIYKALKLATLSKNYSKVDEQIRRVVNLGHYYEAQYSLLGTLYALFEHEQKASSHDRSILNNLREDFLKQWNAVTQIKDAVKKNKEMEQLVGKMVQKCEKAAGEVKDKTSGALIKNILLILSAVLSFGVSLGIYALATRKERAAGGSFFFKDTELSKDKIDHVKKNLEDVQSEIKKNM